tara:strand:+ start:9381 stop:9947 length:567 start_codon:yes stop_codon:yes gene_type:complete
MQKIIDGDASLQNLCLENLPNLLSNVKIMGNFDCRWNNLISLKNAPNIDNDKYFYCGENNLTNLIGIPLNFGKRCTFDCSQNELTSLEGAPVNVWSFNCAYNRLKDLEYAPKIVSGGFYCNNNRLESFRGAPHTVEGSVMCLNNPLISLKGIPKIIGEALYLPMAVKNVFPEEYIRSLSDIRGVVSYW